MRKELFVVLAAIALAACGNSGEPKQVTQTRTVAAPSAPPAAKAMPPMGGEKAMPPGHPSVAPFQYVKPDSWDEAPPTTMRMANFRLKANPEAECYLTLLQGAAGGVAANINRWRAQMQQPELSEAEVAALPEVDVLGKPSKVVELTGNYVGMTGGEKAGHMLLGMVTELSGRTLFVKMTGPEAVVRPEKDNFLAFCRSLRESAPAAAPEPATK